MRTQPLLRNIGLVLLAFMAAGACGDDATGPSRAEVAGTYAATSLTMTVPGGAPLDLIALGSEVGLELNLDGTARGLLFMPGFDEGGGDLDLDLEGTWSLTGSTVTLSPTADVFLEDIPLAANGETLVGDRTIDGVRIRVTLTRQ